MVKKEGRYGKGRKVGRKERKEGRKAWKVKKGKTARRDRKEGGLKEGQGGKERRYGK
jgi:hypothetical protein